MPVFAAGNMKFTGPEIVKILLDKSQQKSCVSKKQPLRTTDSKVFLVDTDQLAHPDDIKADDLGSWRNDGQHLCWVKVKENAVNKAVGEILAFGTDGEGPLIEAFSRQCQLATHLTCFTHSKGNIKRKLQEIGIPSDLPTLTHSA